MPTNDVDWAIYHLSKVKALEPEILKKHGKEALQKAYALATRDDEADVAAWEAYKAQRDGSGPSVEEYVQGGRAAYEAIQSPRVRQRADEDNKSIGRAIKSYMSSRQSYEFQRGSASRLTEQPSGVLPPEAAAVAAELKDFRTYLTAYRRGDLAAEGQGASERQIAARSTALGLETTMSTIDPQKELVGQQQAGVTPIEVRSDALDRKLARSSADLRNRVSSTPDFRDKLARFSRASDLYLQMGAQRDQLAAQQVATGEAQNYREAQENITATLEKTFEELEASKGAIEQEFGSIGGLSGMAASLPAPRHGKDGFLGALEDMARGILEFASPVTGGRGKQVAGIMFPRSEESGFQTPGDVAGLDQGARALLPPGVQQLSEMALVPLNWQTAREEAGVLLGPIAAQFGVGGVVAGGAEVGLARAGLGAIPRTALREGVRFGVAEAVTPNVELGDFEERGRRAGIAAGIGATLGTVGGVLAKKKVQKATAAAIEKPTAKVLKVEPVVKSPKVKADPIAPSTASLSDLNTEAGTKTIVEKVQEVLKKSTPLRKEQEKLFTASRGRKIPGISLARASAFGRGSRAAEKQALRGELDKVDFAPIVQNFSENEINVLYQKVKDAKMLAFWEKEGALDALDNMFHSQRPLVPQANQIEKLSRVFGTDFARSIESLTHRPGSLGPRGQAALETMGIAKTMKAGFDFSMGRQATFAFTTFPKETANAVFKQQFKFWKSEKNLTAAKERMVAHPNFETWKKAKLAMTAILEGSPNLLDREEQFIAANFVESLASRKGVRNFPIRSLGRAIRASDRAFTGGLTQLRFDMAETVLRRAEAAGHKASPELANKIANFVNVWTGRGNLGALENSAGALAGALFSPRFTASRLSIVANPRNYVTANFIRKRLPKGSKAAKLLPEVSKEEVFIRQQKLAATMSTVGAGTAMLTLMAQAKKAFPKEDIEVEPNPFSTDFGKYRIGKTRFDIWGGAQQPAVMLARIMSGKTKSSMTGKTSELGGRFGSRTGGDVFIDFFLNKVAPAPNIALDLMRREKRFGEPLTPQGFAKDLFMPLIMDDAIDIARTDPWLLPGLVPMAFGVGGQTYPIDQPIRELKNFATKYDKKGDPRVKDVLKEQTKINKLKDTDPERYEAEMKKLKERAKRVMVQVSGVK